MGQSKRHSFLESTTNTVTGIILAFGISQIAHHEQHFIQTYIWRGFVWDLSPASNMVMTLILTVVSFSRGYTVRRFFNKLGNIK